MPTKTRDFQFLLSIKVILIDKEMAMNLINQDLHQICNVMSILCINGIKSTFLKIATVVVLEILNCPSLLKSINEPNVLESL